MYAPRAKKTIHTSAHRDLRPITSKKLYYLNHLYEGKFGNQSIFFFFRAKQVLTLSARRYRRYPEIERVCYAFWYFWYKCTTPTVQTQSSVWSAFEQTMRTSRRESRHLLHARHVFLERIFQTSPDLQLIQWCCCFFTLNCNCYFSRGGDHVLPQSCV